MEGDAEYVNCRQEIQLAYVEDLLRFVEKHAGRDLATTHCPNHPK